MENLEEFVPIKGYEGKYAVNRKGQIKSIARRLRPIDTILKYVIAGTIKYGGYAKYNFWFNGKNKQVYGHRIVAKTFIPNPETKPQVNHINGIKTDNRVENLEWCTEKENVTHGFDTGLFDNVVKIIICTRTGEKWKYITECAKFHGMAYTTLANQLNPKSKKNNKTTLKYHV